MRSTPSPYTAVLLIPTGVGCAMGGYAGDALPLARALAQGVDCLITHPNVLNGAQLYWPIPNALYVEGYGLDRFAAGDWGLLPVTQNRVGLVLDAGIEPQLRLRHLQAADATRASLGLCLTDYVITDRPLDISLHTSASGVSWGKVQGLDSVFRAVDRLIHGAGANAIAVVTRFPDDVGSDALTAYRTGQGVDPLAGAEAVISHGIVREFQIPCAHAPALEPLPLDPQISPRSAAEEIGYTFLPCVLVGLSRAPQFCTPKSEPRSSQPIYTGQVDVVITPASACGGAGLFHWASQGKTILAVAENTTALRVFPEMLGMSVISVGSYLEALGYVMSLRSGVDPSLLRPQFPSLKPLETFPRS